MAGGAWAAGVALAVCGSSLEAAGLNGMKHSHTAERRREVPTRRPVLRRPLWWAGFGVFLAGNGMDFVALGLVGQSTVALCGSTSMLTNAAVARWLGETFPQRDAYGTLLIIIGVAVTVAFSDRKVQDYDLEEVLARYREPGPAFFIGGVCAAATVLVVFIWAFRGLDSVASDPPPEASEAALESPPRWGAEMVPLQRRGADPSATAEQNKGGQPPDLPAPGGLSQAGLSLMLERPPLERAFCLAHPAVGALIASLAINIGKAVSELFLTTFQGDNQLGKPLSWVLITAFAVCLVAQLHFIDRSLRINDALLHVPVFYVLWNLLAMVGGGVVFEEFAGFGAADYSLFSVGAIILFLGVYFCSAHA